MRRQSKAAEKRAARQALHRDLEQARAQLAGEDSRPTVGTPARGDRHATLRERLPCAGIAALAEHGLEVGEHGAISSAGRSVGQVREAWPGADVPFRVQALVGLALERPRVLRSPTWLALVRMMPCSFCATPRGYALRAQVTGGLWGRSQSEAHHYPPRGRSGGGSDLETCPACTDCHRACTEGRIPEERQADEVARTLREILTGIREGWLQSGLLLAVACEVVI